MTGDDVFEKEIMGRLRKDFQVGSEDKNDFVIVSQCMNITALTSFCQKQHLCLMYVS